MVDSGRIAWSPSKRSSKSLCSLRAGGSIKKSKTITRCSSLSRKMSLHMLSMESSSVLLTFLSIIKLFRQMPAVVVAMRVSKVTRSNRRIRNLKAKRRVFSLQITAVRIRKRTKKKKIVKCMIRCHLNWYLMNTRLTMSLQIPFSNLLCLLRIISMSSE